MGVCAVVPPAHAAGDASAVDRDNGLLDAVLGTPLKNFQGLQKTEDTGRWLSFTRPGDKLDFYGVRLTGVTYNFFKEKLYSISLDVEGTGHVKKMLDVLERRYGKDHTFEVRTFPKTAAQMQVREWSGNKAYCVYKSAGDARGAVLTFVDKPTWDLLQAPRQQQEDQSRNLLKGSYTNGDF